MQNNFDDVTRGDAFVASAHAEGAPSAMSGEDLAQFEQFKKAKLLEQTRDRIARVECDSLSPVPSNGELRLLCREAERIGLGGIVVLPAFVRQCVAYLGTDPSCALFAAVSFPHGADSPAAKVAAVRRAVRDGADGAEVCASYSVLRQGNLAAFRRECKKLVRAARPRSLTLTLDCNFLEESDIVRACGCAADCGAARVRIVNASGRSAVSAAVSAVGGRCDVKAGADDLADMSELETLGAAVASCSNAPEVCSRLLNAAES